ncbi:MAG: ABC transporter ATP-binding protein [Anaerolineae bacterium]|nr:ABC transporter ATP-binding protein [Anaerolineae bacterium]
MTLNHTAPVIEIEKLSKVYQKSRTETIYALKDLDLSVHPGEIFGYLGPNGAGKTTTIRLLLDLIRPTHGRAAIFGQDVNQHSVALHQRIGFLPGELNLWKNLTGRQVIQYVARVRGGVDESYVRRLSERLQFDPTLRVRSYSSGNRRKLGLVLALMNQPELLILDEPTNGLDPLMQQIFNEMMLEIRGEGRTVFLSSHILSEVQSICDRVAILRNGELKAVETVTNLTHVDFRWVTVRLQQPVQPNQLGSIPGVSDISQTEGGLRLRLVGDFDPLLRALGPYYVQDMRVQEPTLEEVFLAFYGNHNAVHAGQVEGRVS